MPNKKAITSFNLAVVRKEVSFFPERKQTQIPHKADFHQVNILSTGPTKRMWINTSLVQHEVKYLHNAYMKMKIS